MWKVSELGVRFCRLTKGLDIGKVGVDVPFQYIVSMMNCSFHRKFSGWIGSAYKFSHLFLRLAQLTDQMVGTLSHKIQLGHLVVDPVVSTHLKL